MRQPFFSLLPLAATALLLTPGAAAPRTSKTRLAALPKTNKTKAALPAALLAAKPAPPLPQYVSLDVIERIRAERARREASGLITHDLPVLQPSWDGVALQRPMRDLMDGPSFEEAPLVPPKKQVEGLRLAQASRPLAPRLPRPLPPAAVPGSTRPRFRPVATPQPVTPRWVRYPLEWQLCGIGLGTRVVDKDQYNRIDRYGLFALHGNPTAVVVPSAGGNIGLNQQPPEVAALFPGSEGGGLPAWAGAITVALDNNHVEWLYRRETYAMGFIVDRLGFVDAIVVAGIQSNIARTQLEDPLHTVKLGDDFRKVLFRYGYPDTLETYNINALGGVSTGAVGAGGAGAGGNTAPGASPPGTGGAAPDPTAAQATTGGAATSAFRTFEIRYEQSYNVVFTIKNNRVVRMYIFGDPDFFNAQRRGLLRAQY